MNQTPTTAFLAAADAVPAGSSSLRAERRRSAELESLISADPGRFRIATGDRPTGPLHLGHYFGTLASRVRLHFTHSAVPALNQLMLPFLSLVSVPELRRNPTVKSEIALSRQLAVSGLMLTYPVHQAADILFCKANVVPVGKDQLPHLQLTRTIARRFNERYASGSSFFPVPDPLLSAAPSLLGTDGKKMGKSRGNAIALSATADETARLIKGAKTDGLRQVTFEPRSRPEVSSLVLLVALCQGRAPAEVAADIGAGGSAELKRVATESVNEFLRPIRARRAELAGDREYLRQVLREGNARANAVAARTLAEVHALMGTGLGAA